MGDANHSNQNNTRGGPEITPKPPQILENIEWIRRYGMRHPGLILLAVLLVAAPWIFSKPWARERARDFVVHLAPASHRPATNILAPHPLTGSAGTELDPAFSPDGNEIAYVWSKEQTGGRGIYVKRIDSGESLELTSDDQDVQSPVWVEDGRYVLYVRPGGDKETKAELWRVPALKGPERKVDLEETNLYPPPFDLRAGLAASSNGLYWAIPEGGAKDVPRGIFLRSTEQTNNEWHRLTKAVFGDTLPSFSPSGSQIAYVGAAELGVEDLYVVSVDGGEPKRLTRDGVRFSGVTWTPDGKEIVFASNRTGVPNQAGMFQLWRMSATGGTPTSLGITYDYLANPVISPKGNHLAYVQEFARSSIWRVVVPHGQTLAEHPVELISAKQETSPQYSPSASKIAFVSNRSGFDEIYVCAKDGANAIPLTNLHGPMTGTPRWSPDGEQIVFDSHPSGGSHIYIIRAEGINKPTQIKSGSDQDAVPSWSIDGKWILFASMRSGAWQIWKTPVKGEGSLKLTNDGGFAPLPSPDKRFVYYAKGVTTPGIWRVPLDGVGPEEPVMDALPVGFWGQWAPTNDGLYFVGLDPDKKPSIQFFRFATQKVERIFAPQKPPLAWTNGLAVTVSPEHSSISILYTQIEQHANIMMIDSFR